MRRGLAMSAVAGGLALLLLQYRRRRRRAQLFDVPEERVTHRVLFCRHGQGHHNLGKALQVPDPELTAQGVAEARAIFAAAAPGRADFKPEVVLVSPLWRTLQTATHAMASRSDGHTCPLIAFEDVREHNNVNACNHRRPLQPAHREAFPAVDFSGVDVDGPPSGAEARTPYKVAFGLLRARAARALEAIDARPEERIAVFCHATFMRAVLSNVMGLDAHHAAKAPHTGQAIEVLRIATPTGEHYWELVNRDRGEHGHEVLRLAFRDDDGNTEQHAGGTAAERDDAVR